MFHLPLLPSRWKPPNLIESWDSSYTTPPPCYTKRSFLEPLHIWIACRFCWEMFHWVLTLSRFSQPVQWLLTSTLCPLVEALPEASWQKPLHLENNVLSKSPSPYTWVNNWLSNTISTTPRLGYSFPSTHADPYNVCSSDILPFERASPTWYIKR